MMSTASSLDASRETPEKLRLAGSFRLTRPGASERLCKRYW